eukprot:1468545-Amphidinium_carterae.3
MIRMRLMDQISVIDSLTSGDIRFFLGGAGCFQFLPAGRAALRVRRCGPKVSSQCTATWVPELHRGI